MEVTINTRKEANSCYCEVCEGCGEEFCCSPIHCTQNENGKYCDSYLRDLKFGYLMYQEYLKFLEEQVGFKEKHKETLEEIFNKVFDRIYK